MTDADGRPLPRGFDPAPLHALVTRRACRARGGDRSAPLVRSLGVRGRREAARRGRDACRAAVFPGSPASPTAFELFPGTMQLPPETTVELPGAALSASRCPRSRRRRRAARRRSSTLEPPADLTEAVEQLVRAILLLADAAGRRDRRAPAQIVSGSTSIAQRSSALLGALRSWRRARERRQPGAQHRLQRLARRRLDQHLHPLDVGDAGDAERHRRVDHHVGAPRQRPCATSAAASRKARAAATVLASAREHREVRVRRQPGARALLQLASRRTRRKSWRPQRLRRADAPGARSAPTSRSARPARRRARRGRPPASAARTGARARGSRC